MTPLTQPLIHERSAMNTKTIFTIDQVKYLLREQPIDWEVSNAGIAIGQDTELYLHLDRLLENLDTNVSSGWDFTFVGRQEFYESVLPEMSHQGRYIAFIAEDTWGEFVGSNGKVTRRPTTHYSAHTTSRAHIQNLIPRAESINALGLNGQQRKQLIWVDTRHNGILDYAGKLEEFYDMIAVAVLRGANVTLGRRHVRQFFNQLIAKYLDDVVKP